MLPTENRQSPVRWEIGELPEVTGDRTLLRLVFQNAARERAELHRAATRGRDPDLPLRAGRRARLLGRGQRHRLRSVAGRIALFQLFQRLHAQEEASGSGIGAGQRRPDREAPRRPGVGGGKIRREGATFYFTSSLMTAQRAGSAPEIEARCCRGAWPTGPQARGRSVRVGGPDAWHREWSGALLSLALARGAKLARASVDALAASTGARLAERAEDGARVAACCARS